MAKYAAETTVTTDSSRAEIERTLRRYGADAFVFAQDGPKVIVMFRLAGRMVRYTLSLPDRNDPQFATHTRGARAPNVAAELWEKACRQKWRALALVIKAKLEAVDAGIVSIEDEFLANTLTASGETVGEAIRADVAQHLLTGGALQLTWKGGE